MMMPSLFVGDSLFDDFMNFPFDKEFEKNFFGKHNPLYGKNADRVMRTDVRETENGYEMDVDLPGFKKDEIQVVLEKGYMTISAAKGVNKDEKNSEGKYIRRERYTGHCSRSFYVGESVRQEDIHAKFEDGILKLQFPKDEPKKLEQSRYITIEG